MSETEYNYAARFPGMPGYGATAVDDPCPKWKKQLAKAIAEWIREGATVERVTREQACAGMLEYTAEIRRRKAEKESSTQESLLMGDVK